MKKPHAPYYSHYYPSVLHAHEVLQSSVSVLPSVLLSTPFINVMFYQILSGERWYVI